MTDLGSIITHRCSCHTTVCALAGILTQPGKGRKIRGGLRPQDGRSAAPINYTRQTATEPTSSEALPIRYDFAESSSTTSGP